MLASNKELTAMTFNLKEQRLLEKFLQTLSIEEAYSLKLVDLNVHSMKAGHKRLKQKVSKIQTHLTKDEISEMANLESRGKLYSSRSLCEGPTTNTLRIQAATKRLKLWSDMDSKTPNSPTVTKSEITTGRKRFGRCVSADRIRTPHTQITDITEVKSIPLSARRCDKVNSDRLPAVLTSRRVKSEEHFSTGPPSSRSAPTSVMRGEIREEKKRPVTSIGYNSHSDRNIDNDSTNKSLTRSKSQAEMMGFSTFSDDEDLGGPSPFEDRRQALLKSESQTALTLDGKREQLLKAINKIIDENPSLEKQTEMERNPYLQTSLSNERAVAARKSRTASRKKKQRVEFRKFGEKLTEEEYKQRLLAMWEGMNKCRYLRVSEDKIDLSGYQTLAKNQMKVFEMLRGGEVEDDDE